MKNVIFYEDRAHPTPATSIHSTVNAIDDTILPRRNVYENCMWLKKYTLKQYLLLSCIISFIFLVKYEIDP